MTKSAAAPAERGSPEQIAYSLEAGKAAAESLAKEAAALKLDELASMTIDVEPACHGVVRVANFTLGEAPYTRFASLPHAEFDMANVDRLKATAFAVLYVHALAQSADAVHSTARVPANLLRRATEIEARMEALCEYLFLDDPELGPECVRLRAGSGARDLAGDLFGYANMYELRPDDVSADRKHYRPTDLADARRTAGEILAHIIAAMTPKQAKAASDLARLWTLLVRRYGEVAAAGQWLFRKDPKVLGLFPPMHAVGRAAR